MKVALLGAGKTGGLVTDLLEQAPTIFDKNNKPTTESLAEHDVVIVFLPGSELNEHIDVLIESGLPVVNGSTGVDWPDNLNDRLKEKSLTWITASNFAIGMNLIKAMLKTIGTAPKILPDAKFSIHDIHHTDKKDAPSGTAKSWAEWLGQPVEFSDERTGDIVGDHKLTMESEFEHISLHHHAKDRSVFASGAIWTAEYLLKNDIEPGLHELSDLMEKELGL